MSQNNCNPGHSGRTTLMRSTNSGAAINQLWGQRLRPGTVSRDAVFSRVCVIAGGGRTRRYLTASAPPRKYTLIINERHTDEQATAPTHRPKATIRPHRRLREKTRPQSAYPHISSAEAAVVCGQWRL
jgi:hypothetical protein